MTENKKNCICFEHSGVQQHLENQDKKLERNCKTASDSHKRIDQIEKEKVSLTMFKLIMGILVTIGIFVIGLNVNAFIKIDDKLDRVDKAVSLMVKLTKG